MTRRIRHATPARPAGPRVLIADDQPDVLEALRLLLKAEGYQLETALLARRRAGGGRGARVRRRADRPQLRARHHLRPGRPRPAHPHPGARPHAARRRDDGLGQRRSRRRSHAPRRARFHPEALGQRAALAIVRTQIELGQALPQGPAPRSGELAAARRGRAQAHRRIGRRCGCPGGHFARRPVGRQRPDHRRERHRQRGGRPDAARGVGRASRPLVTVNTGGLAEGVFESELFGHVRGAFTDAKSDRVGRFELADGARSSSTKSPTSR